MTPPALEPVGEAVLSRVKHTVFRHPESGREFVQQQGMFVALSGAKMFRAGQYTLHLEVEEAVGPALAEAPLELLPAERRREVATSVLRAMIRRAYGLKEAA